LAHDARPHLFQRVAALAAAGFKVVQVTADHGSGLQG
jgi:hypothetical protein